MNHIANNVTLALFFFICLSFFPLLNGIKVYIDPEVDLVARTCKQVKMKDLCLSSLKEEPDSKTATNDEDIALLAVKNAARQGYKASSWLNKTLSDSLRPTKKEVYKQCATYYGSAMRKLDEALTATAQGRYETVKGDLTIATSEAKNCVTEAKVHHASFELNDTFLQLCELATEIITIMYPNPNSNPNPNPN